MLNKDDPIDKAILEHQKIARAERNKLAKQIFDKVQLAVEDNSISRYDLTFVIGKLKNKHLGGK